MFYNIVKGQLLWVRCPMLHFFVTLCREYNKCSLIFLKQRIRLGNAGKQIELCFFAMHSTFAIYSIIQDAPRQCKKTNQALFFCIALDFCYICQTDKLRFI